MARSVLWIDAREVALLLGEQVTPKPTESAPPSRRFGQRNAAMTPPRAPAALSEQPSQFEPASPAEPTKSTAAPEPKSTRPFSFSSGANLERGLDAFLAWVEDRHATTCCYIADGDGLLLAGRRISSASSPFAATGLLSQHLDEISSIATAPLRGYCVFETSQGFSTSTWTERYGKRFVVVLEGANALSDDEVDEVRTALFELFRKAS